VGSADGSTETWRLLLCHSGLGLFIFLRGNAQTEEEKEESSSEPVRLEEA
jgi:hypothetical protein